MKKDYEIPKINTIRFEVKETLTTNVWEEEEPLTSEGVEDWE